MAELAGSIIGIISAGTKVAFVLSQLASDIGSAGQEARMISSEIRTFCAILNTLKDTMDRINNSNYYTHCSDMIRDMTNASVEMFTEVLNAAETLRTITKGKDGRDGKFTFVSKVQWVVFQKPKIVVLRAAIEAYKSNIALMLGTINTVEKVARRMSVICRLTPNHLTQTYANRSIPQLPNNVAQDDQERAILQGLELDCRSSLISLEQAEQQYEEHIMLSSVENFDSSVENSWPGETTDTNTIVKNRPISNTASQQEMILRLARIEVDSIRDSFTRSSTGQESFQDQVIRYSQRLSKLMENDHRTLSQRWSMLLSSSTDGIGEPLYDEDNIYAAHRLGDKQEMPEPKLTLTLPGQEEKYTQFRTWLLCQPWSDQDSILEALRSDVFYDRLSKDKANIFDTVLAQGSLNNSRTPILGTIHSPWTQTDTQLARTISEQAALNHTDKVDAIDTASAEIEPVSAIVCLRNENIVDLSSEAVQAWIRDRTKMLDLSWNCIRSMPRTLSLCVHLRRLDLGHNHLETVPDSLLCLASLIALDLRGNRLRSIPTAISDLKALQVLFLSENEIQGLPLAIGKMRHLRILEFFRNPIVFPSASAFFDMRRSHFPNTSQAYSRFDAIGTVQLKSYLKCYPAPEVTGTNGTTPF